MKTQYQVVEDIYVGRFATDLQTALNDGWEIVPHTFQSHIISKGEDKLPEERWLVVLKKPVKKSWLTFFKRWRKV